MENTNDGFVIADEDLKLRGPGEFFGLRQSGFFQFKIAVIFKCFLNLLARLSIIDSLFIL